MAPGPVITPLNIGRLRGNLGEWYKLPAEHRYANRVEAIAILCYHVAWAGRSVVVDAAAYVTGDLYHHVLEFDEPGRNVYWAEPETMQASKAMLMARAGASGAKVYFAHIEGAWRVEGGTWVVDPLSPAPA